MKCPHCGGEDFRRYRDWGLEGPNGEFQPTLQSECLMCRECDWIAPKQGANR